MFLPVKNILYVKRIQKTRWYSRIRQYFPQKTPTYFDDSEEMANDLAETIMIDWTPGVRKPSIALVRDYEFYPRWTKYIRFYENNGFDYEIVNLHKSDWIDRVKEFDIVMGVYSSELFHLEENRRKYYFLEKHMGKYCFPSQADLFLYEDKILEVFFAEKYNFPFAKTYISHDRDEAIALIETLKYPIVSKINPTSGSVGVELVKDRKHCRKIVDQAFSIHGRKTHKVYFRQKNYVYFQEFIPNDGYDIRVIVVGDRVFGYYRKTPRGDFRASGMDLIEKRDLPMDAMRIARNVNKQIGCPQLAVDMVHGLDGNYQIIEYSPMWQIRSPMQLLVNDVPGTYVFLDDDHCQFVEGKYWIHELALKEFFVKRYLPDVTSQNATKGNPY